MSVSRPVIYVTPSIQLNLRVTPVTAVAKKKEQH